ncbi:hypothetical protein [Zavarzinella formosa]|uniref:hypothetical protein n=1 Tax=Zavarzinella formosa TaxID=360055 RepID=UPI0002FD6F91|nr:hypothetical protein [Zavarzinella formosa]
MSESTDEAGRKTEGETASHGPDFACVIWFGRMFTFNSRQASVVALLWAAWEKGTPWVSEAWLMEKTDYEGSRMKDVFRKHPAWERMIAVGSKNGQAFGTYGLMRPDCGEGES